MQSGTLIDEAARQLNDASNDVWGRRDLAFAVSFVLREIASLRPDIVAETDTMQLASGYAQSVPTDVDRWIEAVRNMGQNGNTPGRTIFNARPDMAEAVKPEIAATKQASEIREIYFDPNLPRTFYTYPPADGTSYIQFRAVKQQPTGDAINQDETTELTVPEIHAPIVLDGVVGHTLNVRRVPTDSAANMAASRWQNFYQALNADRQVKSGQPEPRQ